tara:strand:- start:10374 stop:10706 length:333 start_codon:yes stop_codon:yes gene_type:complete
MKAFIIIVLSCISISGCVLYKSEIRKSQDTYSNFFLCFPEIDSGFTELSIEEKSSLRRKIADEKRNRNFNCSEYSNFVSSKKTMDRINEEDFKDKSSPCRKPNIAACEPR